MPRQWWRPIGTDLPGGDQLPEDREHRRLLPTSVGNRRQQACRGGVLQRHECVQELGPVEVVDRYGAILPQALDVLQIGWPHLPLGHDSEAPALLPGLAARRAELRAVCPPGLTPVGTVLHRT